MGPIRDLEGLEIDSSDEEMEECQEHIKSHKGLIPRPVQYTYELIDSGCCRKLLDVTLVDEFEGSDRPLTRGEVRAILARQN